jgi:hypothetical protein
LGPTRFGHIPLAARASSASVDDRSMTQEGVMSLALRFDRLIMGAAFLFVIAIVLGAF